MDPSTALFAPGGLPLGMLAMLLSQQQPAAQANAAPSDRDMANATAQLAAKMRQQSTDVPPPEGQPAVSSGDTFDQKWSGILNSPLPENLPLPQPRPNDAITQSQLPTMKSVGSPDNGLDQSVLDALPANSRPTQGVAPPSVARAAPSAGPSLGDRLMAGFANFGAGGKAGGLLGALSGAIGGATTGIRMDPLGVMNQTVQALANRGVPEDMATVLARSPQMLNQMLPMLMGTRPKQFTAIGHDAFQQPIYGFVDNISGKVYDMGGKEIQGGQMPGQAGVVGMNANGQPLTGQAYLDALKGTQYESKIPVIKGIASGELPYPTGMYLKTPIGQWLQTAISTYAPGFNAQTYQQRASAYKDWYGGGKDSGAVKAMQQASDHAVSLINSIDKLGNYSGGALVNKPLNELGSYIGKTGFNPVVTNAHALADELAGIWRTQGMSDSEIKAWGDAFRPNGSIPQQKEDISKLMELFQGGINALETKRANAFGAEAAHLPPIVSPQMQVNLDKVEAWANGNKKPSSPAQSASPTTASQAPAQSDALAQARDAIAKGANRTQVILRLQKMGVNTSGL